jgi:hypothetical protein
MQQMQEAEETKTAVPLMFRARVFLILGWTLLVLSLAFLAIDVLWMWRMLGNRAAPLVAIGLLMDAIVGLGLIIAGHRIRRKR